MSACKQCGASVIWKRVTNDKGREQWQCFNADGVTVHWDSCSKRRWQQVKATGQRFENEHESGYAASVHGTKFDRLNAGTQQKGLNMIITDEMVEMFLTWPLPDSVCADLCATKQGAPYRSGTNLLSAIEARKMLEHVLSGTQQNAAPGGGGQHCYLAGPMRGIPEYNFPSFFAAATSLRTRGIEVWSPAENDVHQDSFDPAKDTPHPMLHYMKRDLPAVLNADFVAVLPGWETSQGATLEVNVARACGIPVLLADTLEPASEPAPDAAPGMPEYPVVFESREDGWVFPHILQKHYDELCAQAREANALRDALDHIMRVAREGITPTRRLDWIALRAKYALEGKLWSRDVRDDPRNSVLKMTKENVELRERLEAAEKDAARYQWLRECGGYVTHSDPEKCDAAIDAASAGDGNE